MSFNYLIITPLKLFKPPPGQHFHQAHQSAPPPS